MPSPCNVERRAELLTGVVDYIFDHGVVGLSLRPLAAELGTSPRMLMHYFGSKERLLVVAFEQVRPDIARATAHVQTLADFRRVSIGVWREMCTGRLGQYVSVLLQVLSLPTADPMRVALSGYITEVLPTWTAPLNDALVRGGLPTAVAQARATALIAGFRGLLLDRSVSHDEARTDAAAAELVALATLPASATQAQ